MELQMFLLRANLFAVASVLLVSCGNAGDNATAKTQPKATETPFEVNFSELLPCSFLEEDEVSAILSVPVTKGEREPRSGVRPTWSCTWSDANFEIWASVEVAIWPDIENLSSYLDEVIAGERLEGVSTEAMWTEGDLIVGRVSNLQLNTRIGGDHDFDEDTLKAKTLELQDKVASNF